MARVNASPRERLIQAGLALLQRDGPEALRARKVSAEIGASTMAVYTHFGGMDGLLEAIVAASFERFGAALAAAPTTADPITDLLVMGYSYREFALASPHRYRLMFGLASPLLFHVPTADMPVAAATFDQLMTAVQRIIDTGEVRADNVIDLAGRVWSMIHGVVLLEIVGALAPDGRALTHILGPMTVDVLVGMGAKRPKAERSLQRARMTINDRG